MPHHDEESRPPRKRSPARTPEERESILISKSLNLIERQIDDGNVSSQVLSLYAKLGTSRERLEQERLRNENELLKQKVKTLEDAVDVKNLMNEALNAFKGYTGDDDESEYDDYDD